MYYDHRFDAAAAYDTGSDDQKAAAGKAADAVMARANAPAITLLTKWRWMIAIIGRRNLSDRAKVMAQAIADDYRDARGHARRGYTHLAQATGSSVRTAQRAIAELVRAGVIGKENEWDPETRKYSVNFYRPVWNLVSSDLTIPHAADQGGVDRSDDTPYPEGGV